MDGTRILVISDTHKHIDDVIHILSNRNDIDRVIHLGDHINDAVDIESIFDDIPMDYVKGNCDYYENVCKSEKIIIVNNKKILLTHGHNYDVKYGYDKLLSVAKINKVDAILFGHTHVPYNEYKENILLFNPGSISSGRSNKGNTYGVLEVFDNKPITATLHKLKKK